MKKLCFYFCPDPVDTGNGTSSSEDATSTTNDTAAASDGTSTDSGATSTTNDTSPGPDTSSSGADDAPTTNDAAASDGTSTNSDATATTDDTPATSGDTSSDDGSTATTNDTPTTSDDTSSGDSSTATTNDAPATSDDTSPDSGATSKTKDQSTSDDTSSADGSTATTNDAPATSDDTSPASGATSNTKDQSSASTDKSGAAGKATSGGNGTTTAATDATTKDTTTDTQYLFVDVYSGDLNGTPKWDVLIKDSRFYGAIIKATQGPKGYSNDNGWFKKNWPVLKTISGDRYGKTWFRGAYLFLNLWSDGAAQADHYLDTVTDAGGWDAGDIIPIIDVELGNDGKKTGKRNPNQDVTAQHIIDCATACAKRLRSVTGRNVMLYGRGAMRDKHIKDKMGCDVVWNPCYTASIVMNGLEAWTLDDVALWQYCGDGVAGIDEKKLPRSVPGFGKVDLSVYIEGKNKPSLSKMIERLGVGTVQ